MRADDILLLLFWCMVGFTLFGFAYPWRFPTRLSRVLAHVPALVLPCYVAYETLMPPEVDIRIDLLVVIPLVIASLFCYGAKLQLLLWLRGIEARPGFRWQTPHHR
jgi:hypothetical protein